jgi:hypothetical protein
VAYVVPIMNLAVRVASSSLSLELEWSSLALQMLSSVCGWRLLTAVTLRLHSQQPPCAEPQKSPTLLFNTDILKMFQMKYTEAQEAGSRRNALDLYSGGSRFESRAGQRLP